MRNYNVLFSTKCWENDYQKLYEYEFEDKIDRCDYDFAERWIVINNVQDVHKVYNLFKGKADRVYVAEEYAEEALKFFNIERESFGKGYIYSICELVELYLARDFNYICHYSSDTKNLYTSDWITRGVDILQNNPKIWCVAPKCIQDPWSSDTLTTWFSDQCYLVEVDKFRKPDIYNYLLPEENQYPEYGGNSFERRCGRYMINNNKSRLWLAEHICFHPSI